ncbi:MAG: TolQ protein [Rickettsiales bacterium]|jgi:TolQ protein
MYKSMIFENNSQIIELISDADIVVKSVMALLLLMSLTSWSIIFFKLIKFSILKILMWKFILLFESKNSLNDILTLAQGNNKNPLSRIIIASIKEWQLSKSKDMEHNDNKLESITNRIKGAIEIVENNIVKSLESGTNILAIIGSNAPFIGLFGTVWGIMNSFQNIADSGNTSLAIVAPGIAEALFATAMGLFVAIPAVIFFNILNKRIDHFSTQIDNFSISILNKIIRKIE